MGGRRAADIVLTRRDPDRDVARRVDACEEWSNRRRVARIGGGVIHTHETQQARIVRVYRVMRLLSGWCTVVLVALVSKFLDLKVGFVGSSFIELVEHGRNDAATDKSGEQDQCGYVPT